MIERLKKSGQDLELILTKEMRDHLGLKDNQIEVSFESDSIVLRAPRKAQSFEEASEASFKQFDTALDNLAK